jgi:hypothetical protein
MKEYKRSYPLFSLCGLNCGLCPRFHTDGDSRCPGCGGTDLKHPACAVITCNKKHDNVEFCFQCSSFPCDRYGKPSEVDSFITYRNVLSDFKKTKKTGIDAYKKELYEKVKILDYLIKTCNDGRKKGFYCIAVNLLDLSDLKSALEEFDEQLAKPNSTLKEKAALMTDRLNGIAKRKNIELILRSK